MSTTTSLWPEFSAQAKPRGMRQILENAGGDIAEKTRGVVEFRVKTYSEGDKFYHDCYLVVPRVRFQHLLLRVITDAKPFPATLATLRGQTIGSIPDEANLRETLKEHFQSQETREVVENLIANFGEPPTD